MGATEDMKSEVHDTQFDLGDGNATEESKGGTTDDVFDMRRMGKVQELKRNFGFITIFGFTTIAMGTWEASFGLMSLGLTNGGTAGLIWLFLVCWVGFIFINMAMAEMGSMAPTSGGQYHWVSEFAPRKYQKLLSYLTGWICVLGWQANAASSAYVAATQIQGLLVLNYPDSYVSERWHATLMMMAIAAFSVVFNTFFARRLPFVEGVAVVIHIWAFVAIVVVLWVLSPTADAKTVFTTFNDGGDWNNVGGSALIGISASVMTFFGGDAPAHMSEELKNASRTVPRAMIWTTIVNGLMGWIAIITVCFCIGDDLTGVLTSPTGYPFIQVFWNATGSVAAATGLTVIVLLMTIFSNLAVVATGSRQLFAFARDEGLPFGTWLARVSPSWNLPFNAILVTFIVSTLLALINIGSSSAFNSITSLSTNAFLTSYMVSIGCLIWRRWTGSQLLPSKFDLGWWGLPIYFTAEIFLTVAFVLCFFPQAPNPNAVTMNWNIVIYGGVVVIATIYYIFRARYRYVGPVEYVRKLD